MASKDTRSDLLHAATNLFYLKGYQETSIREIGQKANISNSIIYHYFKNKEEMLFEIIQAASQDLVNALVEIQQRVKDPVECLQEMLTTHMVVWCLKRKKEIKIVVADDFFLTGKRREANRNIQREIYRLYMVKLEELRETGLLAPPHRLDELRQRLEERTVHQRQDALDLVESGVPPHRRERLEQVAHQSAQQLGVEDPIGLRQRPQRGPRTPQLALHLRKLAGLLDPPQARDDRVEEVQQDQRHVLIEVELAVVSPVSLTGVLVQAFEDGE